MNQRVLKVLGNVDVGDYVLIKTFGLNHRRCIDKVYLWSDEAILRTGLPPPINLDDVSIKTIILPLTPIGPDNSTLVVDEFVAEIDGYANPSNDTEGRYLEVRVTGDNVDFSSPMTVTLNGDSSGGATEVLTFTSPGKQITTYKWKFIGPTIDVVVTPFNTMKNSSAVEIKEAYSIIQPAGNNIYPVIRFAYRTQAGLSLACDGGPIVSDPNGYFPASEIGNLFEITSPIGAAGIYKIEDRLDNNTIRLDRNVGVSFSDGAYESFKISIVSPEVA
jgi:hypothetical protein